MVNNSPRIAFIGSGNMAWNLCHAFQQSDARVMQVISRSLENTQKFADKFKIPKAGIDFSELLPDLDLLIIATNDQAIGEVAQSLAPFLGKGTICVHCSGSVALAALAPLGKQAGVLYPMQTMNKHKLADFKQVPVFIEGNPDIFNRLKDYADLISEKVVPLDSAERQKLHLGAVFACNFPNLMWMIASELLEELPGVDFAVYEHLVRETVDNVFRLGPAKAQTGPARRKDENTMKTHAAALEKFDPEIKELYQELSKRIMEKFSSSRNTAPKKD